MNLVKTLGELKKLGYTPKSIKEVVEDIYKFSNHYVKIVLHKEPDTEINLAFKIGR